MKEQKEGREGNGAGERARDFWRGAAFDASAGLELNVEATEE